MEEDEAVPGFQRATGNDYIPTASLLSQRFSGQKLLLQQGEATTGQELCWESPPAEPEDIIWLYSVPLFALLSLNCCTLQVVSQHPSPTGSPPCRVLLESWGAQYMIRPSFSRVYPFGLHPPFPDAWAPLWQVLRASIPIEGNAHYFPSLSIQTSDGPQNVSS